MQIRRRDRFRTVPAPELQRPKISYPAKEFIAADPEIWTPKPQLAAKKEGAKPASKP